MPVHGIKWFRSEQLMETHSLNAWTDGDTLVADHFTTKSGWFSQFPITTVGPLPEFPSPRPATCPGSTRGS